MAIVLLHLIVNCPLDKSPSSLYLHWYIQIPAWISNHITGKLWGEITNPFSNFNGCIISPHFAVYLITYICWYCSSSILVKAISGSNYPLSATVHLILSSVFELPMHWIYRRPALNHQHCDDNEVTSTPWGAYYFTKLFTVIIYPNECLGAIFKGIPQHTLLII